MQRVYVSCGQTVNYTEDHWQSNRGAIDVAASYVQVRGSDRRREPEPNSQHQGQQDQTPENTLKNTQSRHNSSRCGHKPRTLETVYISHAPRTLAAMSLVQRRAATEVVVSSARERDMGITAGSGTDMKTVTGYMTVVIMVCCMLVRLLEVWCKITLRCGNNRPYIANRTVNTF